MSGFPPSYQIIPCNEAPNQVITITLGGQACVIQLLTKSIFVPVQAPTEPALDPNPRYENQNPCFVNLWIDSGATLVIGGVIAKHNSLLVRDVYLGFSGDLVVFDTSGADEDPQGVPTRLPPNWLRSQEQQRQFPLAEGDRAPVNIAGRIPGMGSRWLLLYLLAGSYTPGYSLPR